MENWITKTIKSAVLTGHTRSVRSVIFSLDGATLVSASLDTTIKLWDSTNGTHKETLTEHTSPVNSVVFKPDSSVFASASEDGTIRLWDTGTGKVRRVLTGHTDWVWSVAFSPNGNTIASGSLDNTVRLWDLASGAHKATSRDIRAAFWALLSTLMGAFSQVGVLIAQSSYGR